MLQITESIEVNAPPSEVWRHLAKLDDVQHFVASVKRSVYSSERREGVGAARTCEIKGFGKLVETITDWEEGRTLTYEVEGMPAFVKHAQSTWTVEGKNQSQTIVTVRNVMQTRYGFLGKMMEQYAMKPRVTRLLGDAVREFKQHVEQAPAPEAPGALERAREHVR